jgi:UDP-N-acetylmuramoylalanine--D-glutamate ligase
MQLAGQRVLVMGMGRSGVSAAKYALSAGAMVTVTDTREDAARVTGAIHSYGSHTRSDFTDADLIIVSPGIPAAAPDIVAAQIAGVKVISELGFAAEIIQARNIPIIAVTGTNGKSSVTWFIGQFLKAAGHSAFVGGNLGVALSELAASDERPDFAVIEVSSYQLELPGGLAPVAAAVLNLAPDHLGRHGSMGVYGATKTALFAAMPEHGFAVLPSAQSTNPDGLLVHGDTRAKPLWLDQNPGVSRDGDTLHLSGTPDDGTINLSGLTLLGAHNRDNAAAAALLSVCAGVPRKAIRPAVLSALPHRLEPVHSGGGITWVNDSKATNVDAAMVGISGINAPLILLLGGAGKEGSDYRRLNAPIARSTRAVICFGAAGPEIAEMIACPVVLTVDSLSEAVDTAASLAQASDVVLLSPAAASFDEFTNFEERGSVFTALAQERKP